MRPAEAVPDAVRRILVAQSNNDARTHICTSPMPMLSPPVEGLNCEILHVHTQHGGGAAIPKEQLGMPVLDVFAALAEGQNFLTDNTLWANKQQNRSCQASGLFAVPTAPVSSTDDTMVSHNSIMEPVHLHP
jgi:hypothetical protein